MPHGPCENRVSRRARRLVLLVGLALSAAAAGSTVSSTLPADRPRSGAEIVRDTCGLCHGTGLSGAPRIGNTREWRNRARSGLDGLVRSAAAGKGAMPVRGGMPDLTDAELRAAIAYMSGLEDSP